MRRRFRLVLAAFLAALVAAFFAMPLIKGDQCRRAGGHWDRATLSCKR